MRKQKFDKRTEKAIFKFLDGHAKRNGLAAAKHAASKWLNAQRIRASVEKERRALESRLRELERGLP